MIEYLIVFLPLIGALLAGVFINFRESIILQFLTAALIGLASILSWILFFTISDSYIIYLFPWVNAGNLQSTFSINVDNLTALMFLVVTTVSFVVHIYSIGYMKHDKHKSRFFAYLSLFTFAMLVLVSSDDLLQLFLGWEGVGLCSYLLIGFWFKKESANLASMKAFIANRVGDFSLLIGIFSIYYIFGSVNFNDIFSGLKVASEKEIFGISAITFICIALFIGCMGKSAQIGLHTWLPDAMEGPTPVSALIHAATMVTAGVFLVVRLSPLFEYSEVARNLILSVGSVTAVFAGSIAIFQTDIKKIIAYSTCSQLGYMFVACGVSAYGVAMFHLATHAFFKALLFLCAGNVIHAVHHEQDIHKMGGLRRKIPSTYYMMLIGSLALCGIFPFAGYYSKDLIIEAASAKQLAFCVAIFAAFLTSLYSFKVMFAVFHGEEKPSKKNFHEPEKIMTRPLLLLTVLSVVSGYVGLNSIGIISENFWLGTNVVVKNLPELHGILHYLPTIFSALGIFVVYKFRDYLYKNREIKIQGCKRIFSIIKNKYYFDEIYDTLIVKNIRALSNFFWKIIDVRFIDFFPNFSADLIKLSARVAIRFQTGYVYHYCLLMIVGVFVLALFLH